MEKPIPNFEDYHATEDGKIISYKYKTPRIMKTQYQNNGYEYIKICKNNIVYTKRVHRLIAETFLPNPNKFPEVNHKNKNRADNRVENLEWSTRIDNLKDSYETMPPTRNFRQCSLYKSDDTERIKDFNSIKEAAEYAHSTFGCSLSGMIKNYKSKGYHLEFSKV